jgi:hypothetical protein
MGIDEKTRVIRAGTRFSPQRMLRQKPGFPRAHPVYFFLHFFIFMQYE